MAKYKRELKAFVQLKSSGEAVPGGPIFRYRKPTVGNWKEIPISACCNPIYYKVQNCVTSDITYYGPIINTNIVTGTSVFVPNSAESHVIIGQEIAYVITGSETDLSDNGLMGCI